MRGCLGAHKYNPLLLRMDLHGQLVKGNAHEDSSSVPSAAKPTRRATRAQLQAQEEAKLFKDIIPLNIRREVEDIDEDLWTLVKNMPK